MKALFIAIQDKLIADVTALKMIDFDLGQTEVEPLPPLDYPACLISFGDSPFEDFGQLTQEATVSINIRLVFRVFERTHSITPEEYRAIGLQHLDIVDDVKWALHGLAGDAFSSIAHRSFATEPRADLRVYALTFETRLCVAPPVPTYVPWANTDGQEGGPDLCIQDQDGDPIE